MIPHLRNPAEKTAGMSMILQEWPPVSLLACQACFARRLLNLPEYIAKQFNYGPRKEQSGETALHCKPQAAACLHHMFACILHRAKPRLTSRWR